VQYNGKSGPAIIDAELRNRQELEGRGVLNKKFQNKIGN
jgi:hypothetical protein